jgi:hypothetical protein
MVAFQYGFFDELCKLSAELSKNHVESFSSLPWNWEKMVEEHVVQPRYYYSKDRYVAGKPEKLKDDQFSIITHPNLKTIPSDELSERNKDSGNIPNKEDFIRFVKNPDAWYDRKIDQVYDGIHERGFTPEHFGGKDIRKTKS